MSIETLHKNYIQKSRVFLYPMLDIKRGVSVTPNEVYISWEGHYKPEDMKLICLYHLRSDDDFKLFEKTKLLGSKLFHDFKLVEDNKGVFVFDFSQYKEDWSYFLKGKYSKLSLSFKNKIKSFNLNSSSYDYVESFLEPDKYYEVYSALLGLTVETLRSIGELYDPPDIEKETLKIPVLDLDFKSILP